jgi:hypothetical protein
MTNQVFVTRGCLSSGPAGRAEKRPAAPLHERTDKSALSISTSLSILHRSEVLLLHFHQLHQGLGDDAVALGNDGDEQDDGCRNQAFRQKARPPPLP